MDHPGHGPAQPVEFWMGKAVEWGQALSPAAQLDVALHLAQLKGFLQHILQELRVMGSTREVMRTRPFVGQLLGRLCWNAFVTADRECRTCLLQCLCCMYSTQPQGAVELKANQWIQKLLCHLSSVEGSSTAERLVNVSCTSTQYHLELLKNTVALLVKDMDGTSCTQGAALGGCSCERVRGVSVSCIPLVTCPEAAPLIGALLQRPAVCNKAELCEAFLDSVSGALLGKKLVLEEQAVMGLWCKSLTSVERAALHLLECALSNPEPSTQELEQLVAASLLPKASALHCPLFLVVNDIFRAALLRAPGSLALQALLQAFTGRLLQAWARADPQDRLPLRAFFPDAPPSLLMPLLKLPSDVPEEAWPEHLLWISRSIQRTLKDDDESRPRWCREPLEAWLLLAQCGHWLGVAGQHLALCSPEVSAPLLWLLTFYHHQARTEPNTLSVAEEALRHLRALFPGSHAPPAPPEEHVCALVDLMASCSHQASAELLLLQLVASFCAFSLGPVSTAVELLRAMKAQSDPSPDAIVLLAGAQHGLRGREALARLRTIQDILR